MTKLLSCDLKVTRSNRENNFSSEVRLRIFTFLDFTSWKPRALGCSLLTFHDLHFNHTILGLMMRWRTPEIFDFFGVQFFHE